MKINELIQLAEWYRNNVPKMTRDKRLRARMILFKSNKINEYIKEAIWDYTCNCKTKEELIVVLVFKYKNESNGQISQNIV